MYGDFILVGEGKTAQTLCRIYLKDAGARDEAWLRDAILARPQILPIADIDPTVGALRGDGVGFPSPRRRLQVGEAAGQLSAVFQSGDM